jgi:YDG domain/MBG domain (YGX type)
VGASAPDDAPCARPSAAANQALEKDSVKHKFSLYTTFGRTVRRFGSLVAGVVLLLPIILAPVSAFAATIQTDLSVYQNGDTVTITGSGFGPTETVGLITTDPNSTIVDQGAATTDSQGSLTYQFILNATVAGLYTVNATGETSGLSASTQFDPKDKTSLTLSFTSPGSYGTAAAMSGTLNDDTAGSLMAGATISFATYSNSSCSAGQLLQTLGTATTGTSGANLGRYNFNARPASGSQFVQASYGGDTTHMNSDSTCIALTINPAATSTTGSASPTTIATGGSTVVSWTVSSTGGVTGATATGTAAIVQTAGPGTLTCSPASPSISAPETTGFGFTYTVNGSTNSAQRFTCSASAVGTYSYHVHFADSDGNYNASDSAVINLIVTSVSSMSVQSAAGSYGGTVNLTATLTSGGSGVNGRTLSFALNGSSAGTSTTNASGVATLSNASLAGINAGAYSSGVGASFAGDSTFAPSAGTATLTVNTKTVTPSVTVSDKPYDGTTAGTTSSCSLSGVVGTDNVLCDFSTSSATFADKNVGSGKTVTVTGLKLSGTAAANYSLSPTTATTTAAITAKGLTVSFTVQSRTYDGTALATVAGCTLSGVVAGDSVSCVFTGATAQFVDKNVGHGKTLAGTGFSLSGAGSGNYSIGAVNTSSADITPRDLTVIATGIDKGYDGNTSATVTLSTNKVAGDVLTASYTSALFSDKNAGTNKSVSVSGISISGADAGNYHLTSTTAATTAAITVRSVDVNFVADGKTYDGSVTAHIHTCSLSGAVAGDSVACDLSGASASFSDKNVGIAKTVTGAGFGLSGTDAGNYSIHTVITTTANITQRDLTVSATGVKRVYDGTRAATVNLSTDALAGDVVSPAYTSASFADKNVGTGEAVSVSGISISGTDAGNYHLTSATASTTADITQRDLTVSASGINRVYDQTTGASVTLSTNAVLGDAVSAAYTRASFADKNVGTGKPVSVSGISISGTDAGNYHLTSTTASTTATIAPRAVSLRADDKAKILGAADPPLTYTILSGALAGGDSWTGLLTRDPGEAVGSYTIRRGTLTVNDGDTGNDYTLSVTTGTFKILYATPGTCDGAAGHAILQPINTDQSSVFKQGSTVPAKFRVCDVNGASIGTPGVVSSFRLVQTISGTVTSVDEAVYSTTPDTAFRWDSTGQQWIFNISTTNLKSNATYVYVITLNDGSTIQFQFGLK